MSVRITATVTLNHSGRVVTFDRTYEGCGDNPFYDATEVEAGFVEIARGVLEQVVALYGDIRDRDDVHLSIRERADRGGSLA